MTGPSEEACGLCYYCVGQRGLAIKGPKLCQRYPPSVELMPVGRGQMNISGHWPPVPVDAWCGEFKMRLHTVQQEQDDGEGNEGKDDDRQDD